jgi:heme A synthase
VQHGRRPLQSHRQVSLTAVQSLHACPRFVCLYILCVLSAVGAAKYTAVRMMHRGGCCRDMTVITVQAAPAVVSVGSGCRLPITAVHGLLVAAAAHP